MLLSYSYMNIRNITSHTMKMPVQRMSFGAAKPVVPFVGRQLRGDRRQGDPASVRESQYSLPTIFEHRHQPEE